MPNFDWDIFFWRIFTDELPFRCPVLRGPKEGKAQLGIVVLYESVARNRTVDANDSTQSTTLSFRHQLVEDCILDPPTKDATAHNPTIDFQIPANLAANYDANHAIVAELVGQTCLQREAVWIEFKTPHFCLRIAARREVELI